MFGECVMRVGAGKCYSDGRFITQRCVLSSVNLRALADPSSHHQLKTCMRMHTNTHHACNTHPVTGFSGADLSNLVNEAAILAATEGKAEVSQALLASLVQQGVCLHGMCLSWECVFSGWWLWHQAGAAGRVVRQGVLWGMCIGWECVIT